MNALLASVRNIDEADLVVAAGCDWLDLKEPNDGALGAVAPATAQQILGVHRGVLPISATIGDCWQTPAVIPARVAALAALGLDYAKVGFFAGNLTTDFIDRLRQASREVPYLIGVCFAEDPPTMHDVSTLARAGLHGVMLDTADKSGGTLTSRLSPAQIAGFVGAARAANLLVGLAGSLRAVDIPTLAQHGADYLGFRGALCRGHARTGAIDSQAVQEIRRLLSLGSAVSPMTNPARFTGGAFK